MKKIKIFGVSGRLTLAQSESGLVDLSGLTSNQIPHRIAPISLRL